MRRVLLITTFVVASACTSLSTPGSPTTTATNTSPDDQVTGTTVASTTGATVEAPTTTGGDRPSPSSNSSLTCWSAEPVGETEGIRFSDVTDSLGLVEPLLGVYGHAAIWTDIDSDQKADLFVGTFADRDRDRYRHRGATGPSPDRMLIQTAVFELVPTLPEMFSRTSGGAPADLDGDGDLDLVLSRNYRDRIAGQAPTQILRNDDGQLVSTSGTGLPEQIGGRSVAIFDQDLDGILDIFITEDRWSGGQSVLLRNGGDLNFEDVTAYTGLPEDIHGLGVAAADFNNDGLTDLFVAGSNRLFVATADGRFSETGGSTFEWETYGDEDDIAGVSVADLNRDGWLDLAVGHHYNSTIDRDRRVPVRIYLNLGARDDGLPEFMDATPQTGLPGLATKAPHVELVDIDNDGWADLVTSASAADGSRPAVFRHAGLSEGIPRFEVPDGLGSTQYWVATPTTDFDRDGRIDMFLLEWEPARPSILLRNESQSGNWLQVSVAAEEAHGIAWKVSVFDDSGLIGLREITVTQGYSAGVLPVAHFGLGDSANLSVILEPPGDREPIVIENIEPNQHIRYPAGCDS